MPHKDPVTEDVYWEVVERDSALKYRELLVLYLIPDDDEKTKREFRELATRNPCMAPVLDPLGSGPCSGPLTLDHVHHMAGGIKGVRAPSDPRHLVSLCRGHHLDSRAGHIWATANRPLLRRYLEIVYEDHQDEGHQ